MGKFSFYSLALVALALAAISIFAPGEYAYTSLPMIALWAVIALSGLFYIIRTGLYRRLSVFMIHISFIVILAGACVTHFCSSTENVRLRTGRTLSVGDLDIKLLDFSIQTYPGTQAPCDFTSTLSVNGKQMQVSMNRVAQVDGYRIFQSGYDADKGGSRLIVTYDSWGVMITYSGYFMLFLSMLLNLLPLTGRFSRKAVVASALLLCTFSSWAVPRTVPESEALRFGQMFIYNNDRVMPFSTLAREFAVKVTGSPSYKGLSSEQILCGWLFFYDDWKEEDCIHLPAKEVRQAGLGERDGYSLRDFFDGSARYRFSDARMSGSNEIFSLISSASTGSLWTIFPVRNDNGELIWCSPVDNLPVSMGVDEWHFVKHGFDYLAELAATGNWSEFGLVVDKICRFQQKKAAEVLPSPAQVSAEYLFVRLADSAVPGGIMVLLGLIFIFLPGKKRELIVLLLSFIWTAGLVVLNWIASGSVPMSNGYETMQWMAICSFLFAFVYFRRHRRVVPLCLMVGGLALLVAMMGHKTPQVTQLVPVMRSPLLSIHVFTVMAAYSAFAIIALTGIIYLAGKRELLSLARQMLKPALFLMAAGIFVGAIWANQSWGRYWGWDPKEVWALITMIVYSYPIHRASLPRFNSDKFFATYSVCAFLVVIVTYFGVNYLMGGLHSYA